MSSMIIIMLFSLPGQSGWVPQSVVIPTVTLINYAYMCLVLIPRPTAQIKIFFAQRLFLCMFNPRRINSTFFKRRIRIWLRKYLRL